MNWRKILVWWLCGVFCGLTIAQILIDDTEVSRIITAISIGVVILQLSTIMYIFGGMHDNNKKS